MDRIQTGNVNDAFEFLLFLIVKVFGYSNAITVLCHFCLLTRIIESEIENAIDCFHEVWRASFFLGGGG